MKSFIIAVLILLMSVGSAMARNDFMIAVKNKSTGKIEKIYKENSPTLQYLVAAHADKDIELFPLFTNTGGNIGDWTIDSEGQETSPYGNSWQYVKDKLDAALYMWGTDDDISQYLEQKEMGTPTTLTFGQFSTIFSNREEQRAALDNYSTY